MQRSHVFIHLPLEMVREILSNLGVTDLARLAQVDKWFQKLVYHLRIDYKSRTYQPCPPPASIYNDGEHTCTYRVLRKKLSKQVQLEKQRWDELVSLSKLFAGFMLVVAMPPVAGRLIDANVDLGEVMFGLSALNVGSMLSLGTLVWLLAFIFRATLEAKDKPTVRIKACPDIIQESISVPKLKRLDQGPLQQPF